VIPKPYIARWKDTAPWITNEQVEQDLIICRTLIEIFSDDFLRENLAFRGGTALHKLYLNPAPRYSEDIDLVQIKAGPIKPIIDQIETVITFFAEKWSVRQKANNNTILYRFNSEYNPAIRSRLKIEINCREHFTVLGWKAFPFQMESEWYRGRAEITTYSIDELLGAKLRALYQRSKGRDLFELFYSNQHADLDLDNLIQCYKEYIGFVVKKPPTAKQFLLNLQAKKEDPGFPGDMEALLRSGVEFDFSKAFDWMVQEIIEKL
jgi:predicted nucleotidyltransferase component of viral defense system